MSRKNALAVKRTWLAMKKFVRNEALTDREWAALSDLTLIDKSEREFGPSNTRWAASDAERAANLKFYKSL